MRSRSNSTTLHGLEYFYQLVSKTILEFQHPVTGLLPASLYRGLFDIKGTDASDAWVRDNVYSILGVWGLALAYRKNADADEDRARAFELEQRVVKLMRGLLMAMMRQADKVERFKRTQLKEDSLHAKYKTEDLSLVVGDLEWGHLQVDATSLYLLMLGQMTAAGLQIVFTYDEVSFIQNLVFYIETAYRTPDYGVWERGDKTNHGLPELNTSSIGMAKAALEAMSELDLFGAKGGAKSTIHVHADQIQHCKAVLQSMLPKESNSKEIGASLLSIISFPAFAVEDTSLVNFTKCEIIERLQGTYGCRRFLRDGHKTAREDANRLHYEPAELRIFDNIECEWPLFFVYLVLDGFYNDLPLQVNEYWDKLDDLTIKTDDGMVLVPELYYVPADKVELEYQNPHSQDRVCGDHLPHLWSQSLYILAYLLREEYIAVGELDPLNRRYATAPRPDLVIQVAFVAEDTHIKKVLTDGGIPCQTQEEVAPVVVLPARCLGLIYTQLGKNKKLGLTGRIVQNIGLLGAATLYRVGDTLITFSPAFLDYQQFYFCLDNELLVDSLKMEVEYLRANWRMLGRPTLTIPITHILLEDSLNSPTGKFMLQILSGYINGVRVRVGLLNDLVSTSRVQKLDFITQDDLEELILDMPEMIMSPRPSEMLRNPTDDEDEGVEIKSKVGKKKMTVQGSVLRSRSLSRAASWSSDDNSFTLGAVHLNPLSYRQGNVSYGVSNAMNNENEQVSFQEIKEHLESTDSIPEQADILHYLFMTEGPDFDVQLYGIKGCTVRKLLQDLYEKVCHYKYWSLIRHTAGMLRKQVDNLGEASIELLVRQKQLSVGLPHLDKEQVITQPHNPKELSHLIYESCGGDSSTAVLTQEILVYLSMYVKTEPLLFKEMLRLRVGLIMEIMAAEYARVCGFSGEEAADQFMNLSPFQMKSLLYHILSGKEFAVKNDSLSNSIIGLEGRASLSRVKKAVRRISHYGISDSELSDVLESAVNRDIEQRPKFGQWLRRRCLDGALNRVPVDFYPKLWKSLERCSGISISGHVLHHIIVQEMTPGELKFALCVEAALNSIPYPEYRQLMVEALLVLSLIVENDKDFRHNSVIEFEEVVGQANGLFIQHQRNSDGDATDCCAGNKTEKCGANKGICRHFYDSAPSGAYGTMTYFAQILLRKLYGDKAMLQDNCKLFSISEYTKLSSLTPAVSNCHLFSPGSTTVLCPVCILFFS